MSEVATVDGAPGKPRAEVISIDFVCCPERGNGKRGLAVHLTQAADLAARWRMSERTPERHRCKGVRLPYMRVGPHVVYRLEDVEAYEATQLHLGGQ